jgi:decaprenyl-phosphate phosphoribosyltransferase
MKTDRPATAPPNGDASSGVPRRPSLLSGLLRSARPKQWSKNVLVFAAPGAAGVLTQRSVLLHALAAFGIFCMAASGTYLLNDSLDIEADRLHPRKQHRPIAAGVVSVPVAISVAVVLLAGSVVASYFVAGWHLCLVIGIYVALQPLYTAWLKQVAVIDLAAVASGFVLRAIAGGVAVDVPISQWFLIVASFGSLFIVAGKRHAEHIDLGDDRGSHRSTLEEYSLGFLRYVRSVSSAVAIAAYCLWAFEKADAGKAPLWFQLSIVPFVLAIMRYALLLDAGQGGAPEDLILGDGAILTLGALWIVLFAVGVHAG